MSVVNIINIQVLDNPTRFTNPFQFEITFECISALQNDLEWKIIYVGSAEDEKYDQVLDCIMVGPVPIGINKFVFQAEAPKPTFIPATDLLGVTVVLIVCSYNDQEFVRVGYYVNNEYDSEELRMEPPAVPIVERIMRQILADKPRVTRFPVKWDGGVDETAMSKEAMDEAEAMEQAYNQTHPKDLAEDVDNYNMSNNYATTTTTTATTATKHHIFNTDNINNGDINDNYMMDQDEEEYEEDEDNTDSLNEEDEGSSSWMVERSCSEMNSCRSSTGLGSTIKEDVMSTLSHKSECKAGNDSNTILSATNPTTTSDNKSNVPVGLAMAM